MSEEKKVNLPPKMPIDPFRIKLTPEMMLPADKEEREQLIQMRESTTYWKDAMRRLRANKVAMISIAVIIVIFLFAFVGPLFMTSRFAAMSALRRSFRANTFIHSERTIWDAISAFV